MIKKIPVTECIALFNDTMLNNDQGLQRCKPFLIEITFP